MSVARVDDQTLTVTGPHLRELEQVVEMYVLNINAERSRDHGRDLLPEERFSVNLFFGEVLEALQILQDLRWRWHPAADPRPEYPAS